MLIWDATHSWGREITSKYIGNYTSSLAGLKRTLKKIEANSGMTEWLMIDLAIAEALQMEIKYTISHNNQSCLKLWYLSYE